MLKGDLYTIHELVHHEYHMSAVIELNAAHKIFEGHFPNQPVLPGVCMMQMMRELLETALGKPLQLSRATNIKFISLVVPVATPRFTVQATYKVKDDGATIALSASATANEAVCFKFQGAYRVAVLNLSGLSTVKNAY